jgi:hypothetical protein
MPNWIWKIKGETKCAQKELGKCERGPKNLHKRNKKHKVKQNAQKEKKLRSHQGRPKTHKGKLNVLRKTLATCQGRPKCPQIIFWKTQGENKCAQRGVGNTPKKD